MAAEQTNAVVVPLHHAGVTAARARHAHEAARGRPLTFDAHQGKPGSPFTWRAITKEVMAALHALEDRAHGRAARARASARHQRGFVFDVRT